MNALKSFVKTFHFITIAIFIVPALLFFSVTFNFVDNEPIGKAVASVSEYYPATVFHTRDHEPEYFTDFIDENVREIRGTIKAGDSLGKSMARNEVPPEIKSQVIACLKDVIDFGALKVGDTYSLIIRDGKTLEKGYYESGPFQVYAITNEDGQCRVKKEDVLLEKHTVRIAGTVETSLYDAFPKGIKDPRLIYAFADIFASKIDFNTETRAGDRFELVVDEYYRYYDFVGYGKILYARYQRADDDEDIEAFLFDTGKEKAYFNDQGQELGAFFLRSPVPMGRVTSRFTYHRRHPILGVVRQHLGVDLAAPRGTPVMAAADGKVYKMGYNGGFGNQIVLSHGSGYKTYYGHLSRFRKGLKVGMRVKKKEIIGYVGATGMATGPHLDYRISENGRFRNPFSLKFKPRSTLKGEQLARLREKAANIRRIASRLSRKKVLLVKSVIASPETVSFL